MKRIRQVPGRLYNRLPQRRTVRLGHIDMDDAIAAAIKKRTMTGVTGKINKLIGKDKFIGLVVPVDGPYGSR